MLINVPKPEGSFALIPRSVIENGVLWDKNAKAVELYCLLLAMGSRRFENYQHLANTIGGSWTPRSIGKHFRSLRGWGLIIETKEGFDLREEVTEAPKATKRETSIAEEVQEQPKRKLSGLTAKQRKELIKEAWNKHRPDNCMQMDGAMPEPLFIAIQTQTKRLGLDPDDYDGFIGAVLLGIKNDSWWSQRQIKPSMVFGWTANIEDKKFRNTEKLYKAGKTKRGFDWSDNSVLEWFHSKGKTNFKTVEWITVEGELPTQEEADWLNESMDEGATVIRIAKKAESGKPFKWPWSFQAKFAYAPDF